MKKTIFALPFLAALAFAGTAQARDNLSVVGSSTVYPFATVVAETFANETKYPGPIIESTGSGGGLKLFCAGVGLDTPDITNASRQIKDSEIEMCKSNGLQEPVEFMIGYDGIVLGSSVEAAEMDLTLRDIFLALAAEVPNQDGELVPNPHKTWKDVNSSLPDKPIVVLGPPPTSGTRDAFAELALEGGCTTFDSIAALEDANESRFKEVCHTVRSDGAFIEAGENDALIISKLTEDTTRLGVFGFSFLDQNRNLIKGASVGGQAPTFDNIASGAYPISRSLFFYAKKEHVGHVPGMLEYLEEFTSAEAIGKYGYLIDKGLIPVGSQQLRDLQAKVESLK
jgi:phosphate transport system substrate-binding protein